MANRTDVDAKSIHGTNPQNLIEKIVRTKIYETVYWKEHCFGLTAELVVDKAVALKAIGGVYGGVQKPTEFLCLVLKMLQIQPDKDIIVEFIRNEDYKYVRLLGAFYLRLIGRPLEVYQYLEPLYNDYRKVRLRTPDGGYALSHVDQVVDDMLHKDFLFDITLPHIPGRHLLERSNQLEPRISVLEDDFDEEALQKLESEAGAAQRQAAELAGELAAAGRGGGRAGSSSDEDRGRREGRDGRGASSSPDRDRERRRREKWRLERGSRRDRGREGSPRDERSIEEPGEERRHRDGNDRDRNRRERDEYDRDFRTSHRDRSAERNGHSGRDRRRRSRSRSRSRSRERDYGRGRHDRQDRDYDRERGSGRRHRSSSRDRHEGRGRRDDGGRGKEGAGRTANAEDPEIAAANELRAKLGLKPLK